MFDNIQVIHLRINKKILAKMDEEIAEQNLKMKVPYTRSSYIRWAIVMQLEVSRQRRKVGKKSDTFICTTCRKRMPRSALAAKVEGLYGDIELVCVPCDTVGKKP